jgi:hypothetical protein
MPIAPRTLIPAVFALGLLAACEFMVDPDVSELGGGPDAGLGTFESPTQSAEAGAALPSTPSTPSATPVVPASPMSPASPTAPVTPIPAAAPDAGIVPAAPAEAGTQLPVADAAVVPVVDAAVPAVDAAVPVVDAAVPVVDAAVPVVDAAVPVDANVDPCSACPSMSPDAGTYCALVRGVQGCVTVPSCANVRCGTGRVCTMVQVQCVAAPCYPQPQCIATCTGRACTTTP